MDAKTRQMAESFHCPYTVFEAGSEPEKLERAYMEALKEGKRDGFWPAILLLDEYVEEWLGIVAQDGYDREKVIAGCGDNGREILAERLEEYLEDYASEDTRQKGGRLILNETERIPNPKIREIAIRNLKAIAEGKRDFRF